MTSDTSLREGALLSLRRNEIGRGARIETPFGKRLISYADLTATGRYLHCVEAWLERVLPYYANTHTAVSTTGRVISELREEARLRVGQSVGAAEDHVVLFCGAGATAAVNKLVGLLGLHISEPLERGFALARHIPAAERPVVFVGPYEHHSNYLPWLESICEVVEIPCDDAGRIDLGVLERELAAHAGRSLRIGAFSAASNVTGVLSDVQGITLTLRRAGARVVFDYAASAPYVPIDMSPEDPDLAIDAIFVSTHKFLGGAGGSGILVAREDLFRTRTPERPGGGTVDYVGEVGFETVDYVRRLDEREEAGTPAIVADLRAGMAFVVKGQVGADAILEHELELARKAVQRLAAHPRLRVLGPSELPRLGILSLEIQGLHHHLASALLDHLFGIQNRAGCACAGPYGHRLLNIDAQTSERYRGLVRRGLMGMKPGWIRLSLPYHASEEELDFILSAVEFVADFGRELISAYRFSWADGVWRNIEHDVSDYRPVEFDLELSETGVRGPVEAAAEPPIGEAEMRAEREGYFEEARALVVRMGAGGGVEERVWNPPTGDAEVDELVWFDYVWADPLPPTDG